MKNISTYCTVIALALLLIACQESGNLKGGQESLQPLYLQDSTLANAIAGIPQVTTGYGHKAMVLGTFHFNRSTDGSDVVAKNHIDITDEKSQQEIQEIVNAIVADFKPTLVAVEWMPSYQAKFDSLYQEYLKGDWSLVKNEAFQIGFRVAKAMKLPTIHCVDNRPPQPESLNDIEDWDSYAEGVGQTQIFNEYNQDNDEFNAYMDDMLSKLSLKQYLILNNSPAHTERYKALSFTGLVNLGQGDNYVGADLTGNWYRRNTRIFTNVRSLCQTKSERVLIIYGAGHKWALDEIFAGSPEFEVVQPFQ